MKFFIKLINFTIYLSLSLQNHVCPCCGRSYALRNNILQWSIYTYFIVNASFPLICRYAVILAFDVKVERDAQEMADNLGVRIFTADIIYHLFDQFMAHRAEYKKQKQEEFKNIAVFPCKLRILPQYVFNSRDPIVAGVVIEAGFVKEGMPLCVPSKQVRDILLIHLFIMLPASTNTEVERGVYWFHVVCPSVCQSACLGLWTELFPFCNFHNNSRIHFISHILLSNFRRCVVCKVFLCKIPKFEFLANFSNL